VRSLQRLVGDISRDPSETEVIMTYHGKIQLTAIIVAPPNLVEEGDRIFRTHAPWMEATHHRTGPKALLSYNVAKAPEFSNPMDLNSAPTGNTCFVLTEIYETTAGVADHFEQAAASWNEFADLGQWMATCKTTVVAAAPIMNSLWERPAPVQATLA
jgi:hypothetical protein